MVIRKRPTTAGIESFINGAPDASKPAQDAPADPPARKSGSNVVRGNQVQITFSLPASLLERVDRVAEGLAQKRAGYMKRCLAEAVAIDERRMGGG